LQNLLDAAQDVPPPLLQLAVLIGGEVTPETFKSLTGRLRLSNQQRRQWQLWQAGWRCWHSQDRLDWLDWIYLHGLAAGQESLAWWEATWESTWEATREATRDATRDATRATTPTKELADARHQALAVMRRLGDARFATNGDDLLTAGYPPGANLGHHLRTLRRAWLATL
jgi:hypothetical protein